MADTFGFSLSTNGALCPTLGDFIIKPYQRAVFCVCVGSANGLEDQSQAG
jgi:hypothetical protein